MNRFKLRGSLQNSPGYTGSVKYPVRGMEQDSELKNSPPPDVPGWENMFTSFCNLSHHCPQIFTQHNIRKQMYCTTNDHLMYNQFINYIKLLYHQCTYVEMRKHVEVLIIYNYSLEPGQLFTGILCWFFLEKLLGFEEPGKVSRWSASKTQIIQK